VSASRCPRARPQAGPRQHATSCRAHSGRAEASSRRRLPGCGPERHSRCAPDLRMVATGRRDRCRPCRVASPSRMASARRSREMRCGARLVRYRRHCSSARWKKHATDRLPPA
jgi:hypothetical protein